MGQYKFADVEEYFLRRLNNLKVLLNAGNRFEVAILALCYMDALGNLFMKGQGTKQRFMKLICSHGVVDNFRWDKVNLAEFKKVEAAYDLKSKACPSCYERIIQYIDQNLCGYEYSRSRQCVEKDKYLPDVIENILIFSKDKNCRCNVVSEGLLRCLQDSTYAGILYSKYRCEGVHKGKFDELWDSSSCCFDEPFYMSIKDSLPDFSIPPEFILRTFKQCLVGLKGKNQDSCC